MESTGTGSGKQGGRSKRYTAAPIRFITELGLTDENIEKTADATESDEVNSDGDQNTSNDGDSSS